MTRTSITLSLPGLERTFVDPRGITHEALDTCHQIGTVSLCGRLKSPIPFEGNVPDRLWAYACPSAPDGVDCMPCLVARVQLDNLIDQARPGSPIDWRHAPDGMVALDLGVSSWS